MNTLAEQVAHYAAVKRRLMGQTERRKLNAVAIEPTHSPEPEPEPEPADDPPYVPQWRVITEEVCAKHGVSFRDIIGQSKPVPVMAARKEAWWRIRNEVKVGGRPISYPQIARRFSRDHTSVIVSVHNFERERNANSPT